MEEFKDDSVVEPVENLHPFEEKVIVPSKGMFYGGKLPGGVVRIRPISVKEEKLLVNAQDKLSAIDLVLDRCLLTRTLPLNEYLVTDKFFLFLNVRTISYGPDYQFMVKCSGCGNSFRHQVILPQGLRLKVPTDDSVEPFDVFLPMCKKTVSIRFLRGKDETEIRAFAKQTKRPDGDPTYSYSLAKSIVSVDKKEMNPVELLEFVENLYGRDSLAIRNALEKNQSGIDLEIDAECPTCLERFKTPIEFSTEFFRSGVGEE